MGDSNAGQYSDGLLPGVGDGQYNLVLATANGCPLVDVDIETRGQVNEACAGYVTGALNWLRTQQPRLVLLGAANEAIASSDVVLHDPQSGQTATTPSDKAKLWAAGLRRVIYSVEASGHRAAIIGTIPHFTNGDGGWWNLDQCTFLRLASDQSSCAQEVSVQSERLRQGRALASERSVARGASVSLLDLTRLICPENICSTLRGGNWIYRDGLHLSVRTSYSLRGVLSEFVADVLAQPSMAGRSNAVPRVGATAPEVGAESS
ncbi:hypothetical protein GCM10009737_16840 [Nocardioides lentus]|uniref:SGNH domain-containing protein n=2 Tax=Nocardioides lentus TaxID=338077 RepID=A0ABN2PCR5_9ACTN